MAVDNRLTGEQLAALAPGDPVTIEFVRDFRRPKQVAGTVVRVTGSRIVVSCCSRAERVAGGPPEPTSPEQRRQAARVDAAYREWTRNRNDVERVGHLCAAIDHYLQEHLTPAD